MITRHETEGGIFYSNDNGMTKLLNKVYEDGTDFIDNRAVVMDGEAHFIIDDKLNVVYISCAFCHETKFFLVKTPLGGCGVYDFYTSIFIGYEGDGGFSVCRKKKELVFDGDMRKYDIDNMLDRLLAATNDFIQGNLKK